MIARISRLFFLLLLILAAASCARLPDRSADQPLLAFKVPEGEGLFERNAPVFLVENSEQPYNRIGTPRAIATDQPSPEITVDPAGATFYTMPVIWQTSRHRYTNLVYRVHFPEIPLRLVPFYLGAGQNVGLLVIVTLDEVDHPLLYTTLHTCGCYLAFLPTSLLPGDVLPDDWPTGSQNIYGETLPVRLDYPVNGLLPRLNLRLRDGTHRIMDAWLADARQPDARSRAVQARLAPVDALSNLPLGTGETASFFVTEGPRKDYVVDSEKVWERLLISWWALDWRVGEDKRLGRDPGDGRVFYTSLKPWARQASDLRDFAGFLRYWGWHFP